MLNPNCFRGVLGFPVTPFRADLSIDFDALGRNVDEMASHPFCALVAAGGMGEVYSLSPDEIVEVARVTVEAARGRMPVMAGTGFNAPMACDIARRSESAGAACLLVLPPYYINAPEAGLAEYYSAIANACGLPLILYSRDWCAPGPQFVARLAESMPSFVAWKDGQGDMRKLQRLMHYLGNRLAWLGGVGDDAVAAYFALGVKAYTSSISNIVPELALELGRAGLAADFARLDELTRDYVGPLYALRERSRGYEVALTKGAMEILGKTAGPVRSPLPALRERDVEDLRVLMTLYRDFVERGNPAGEGNAPKERRG